MGLFQRIKVKTKAVFRLVKTAIKEFIEGAKEKINKWYARYKFFVEKEQYIERNKANNDEYSVPKNDQDLAKECQAYIDKALPDGLTEALKPLTDERRIEFMKELINDFADIMGVQINNVSFFMPSDMEEASCFGLFISEEQSIALNAMFVLNLDEPKITEHMTRTILHELKHARQHMAIEDDSGLGYDQETLDKWRYNFAYYIKPEECDEAYRKQPIEQDANGWSMLFDLHAESI